MLWRIFGDAIGIKLVCRHYAFHNLVIPQGIKQDWCSQGDKVNSQQGKGFGGGFAFWQFWKSQKKVRLSTQSTCDFPVWHLFLQVHRTCGSVWLQDEKLVPVQMATSSIMSAWYDPSGITADHPPPVCSAHQARPQMANSQNGENILPPARKRSLPATQWPVTKMWNKIKLFSLSEFFASKHSLIFGRRGGSPIKCMEITIYSDSR